MTSDSTGTNEPPPLPAPRKRLVRTLLFVTLAFFAGSVVGSVIVYSAASFVLLLVHGPLIPDARKLVTDLQSGAQKQGDPWPDDPHNDLWTFEEDAEVEYGVSIYDDDVNDLLLVVYWTSWEMHTAFVARNGDSRRDHWFFCDPDKLKRHIELLRKSKDEFNATHKFVEFTRSGERVFQALPTSPNASDEFDPNQGAAR